MENMDNSVKELMDGVKIEKHLDRLRRLANLSDEDSVWRINQTIEHARMELEQFQDTAAAKYSEAAVRRVFPYVEFDVTLFDRQTPEVDKKLAALTDDEELRRNEGALFALNAQIYMSRMHLYDILEIVDDIFPSLKSRRIILGKRFPELTRDFN